MSKRVGPLTLGLPPEQRARALRRLGESIRDQAKLIGAEVPEVVQHDLEMSLDAVAERFRSPGENSGVEPSSYAPALPRQTDADAGSGSGRTSTTETPQVEAALMAHDDVLDAAVIGTDHDILGPVTALVQLRPGREVSVDTLKKQCRARVASIEVPEYILIVDAVPRTEMGKIDYIRKAWPSH